MLSVSATNEEIELNTYASQRNPRTGYCGKMEILSNDVDLHLFV